MLTPDADEYLVKFIAFTIDKELNALCPDANAYTAKARSLVSNLKTNEVQASPTHCDHRRRLTRGLEITGPARRGTQWCYHTCCPC